MSKSDQAIENLYQKLGDRIAKMRKQRGMSQEQLATASEVDRSHIGFIEQNRRRPTLSTLYRIAKALGISLEKLFKGL